MRCIYHIFETVPELRPLLTGNILAKIDEIPLSLDGSLKVSRTQGYQINPIVKISTMKNPIDLKAR